MPPEFSNLDSRDDSVGQLAELDWQAFRYLAGEMSDSESQTFESRLVDELAAGDLSTSEALARMTQRVDVLSEAVVAEQAVGSWRQPGRQARRARWSIVATTTAGLVAALGLWWSAPSRRTPNAEAVVSVWADLVEDARLRADLAGTAKLDVGGSLEATDEQAADELSVPGWLLAAVSQPGSQEGSQGESAGDDRSPRMED